jgi:hypothetical protein
MVVMVMMNTIEFDDIVEGDGVTLDCLRQKSTT